MILRIVGDIMICFSNVSKYYGKRTALDNLSFEAKKGEILGLLGPNGAGKSTAMNIMTGYISASEGVVSIDGMNILEYPERSKKKIGYLPETPPLYMDMTVEEYLKFVFKLKYINCKEINKNIEEIIGLVKINDVRKRLIKNLSKGYKQRVGLAQGLVGNPEILILDEPTGGLDPKQIIDMRDLIKNIKEKHTIILSSHILSEVSALCDRVLIINRGRLVATGTPGELSNRLSYSKRLVLRIKGSNTSDIIEIIKSIPEVEEVTKLENFEPDTLDILVEAAKNKDIREKLYNLLKYTDYVILMMKPVDLTLEEIFLKVTSRSMTGEV